ncbi:unnamed protein product [Rhizoctonia solani]|uniref:C2H2-type domain-containing protein n=1 Tax=Rhizoctonia solani TaxID=456999 RepID=A0A8H3BE74_9AGAM|nr:unnamed protein product [Rhizoctonia solani]
MSSQPYYPPYDPSASSQGSQSSRSRYPQPAYGQYNQPTYGHMGYADMPQSGQRYSQMPVQYSPDSADDGQYMNHEGYAAPSLSPVAATFAQSDSYPADANTMTYRPRHQSTSAILPSGSRHPMPRHPSGELPMASMHEGREFIPVPSQPFYDSNAPVARPVASGRGSNVGQTSSSTSALALEKPYVCDICQTRFARHHDCRRHRETHVVNASGEKPHHCVVCGKSFTRKDALKRHTNQKGCDINAATSSTPARSSRSSSSASPPATFYPISNLPHGSGQPY